MPGAATAELSEGLDIVKRNRRSADDLIIRVYGLHAGEVQQRIEQHRGMPGGEHEPVAIRPDGIVRVEAEEALPQAVRHWSHAHWCAGMPGLGLLDRIHREGANGVDR